ncbi:MAG TPA: GTP cyclohydrolase II RibA [Xanthobacteraceae bacterium]|nr:GTP cyclohydrolase II RibA [Xanthobacteraceae bacterium]
MQLENMPMGVGLFGTADDIAVQRGIAEFRGGRPVVVTNVDEMIVALPVDGLTEATWNAFKALCAPGVPRLLITERRARVIGLEAPGPVFILVVPRDTRDDIWCLAAGLHCEPRSAVGIASDAASRAIELAKLAQRLPALLVADAKAVAPAMLAQMIVVRDDAVTHFNAKILDTLEIVSEARIPLPDGAAARFCVFRDAVGSSPVAIILGKPDFSKPVNVRVHSACLTGDVFGSRRCDCGAQLKLAMAQLSEAGGGIVLYLEQEGRGLGLANKMRAYMLQDDGLDTMDANMMLGFDDDERNYGVAARMLKMIGANRVQLLTNNPGKLEALSEGGVEVCARIALHTEIHPENRRYLATKAARAGHWLDDMLDAGVQPPRETIRSRTGS